MQATIPNISTAPGVHVSALESAFLRELEARSQGRSQGLFVAYGSQALLARQVSNKGLCALSYTARGCRVLLTDKGEALLAYLAKGVGHA